MEAVRLNAIQTELLPAFNKIKQNWSKYRDANLAICDGLGTNRVVERIERIFCTEDEHSIELRRANESDIPIVYQWQCHPETRKYALNPERPSWDEHKKWMRKKLTCIQDYFYIITFSKNQKPVGVLRLDRISTANYLISIFIDPDHYGKGIAQMSLARVEAIHKNITIHATVLKNNLASQQLFLKTGYDRCSEEKFIRKNWVK